MRQLIERYPALQRLVTGRASRVPLVRQTSAVDCGPACVSMALAYHGKEVSVEEIRRKLGTGRDGSSAFGLLVAARNFGLQARGVKVPLERLEALPAGSILHWELNHFVVLSGVSKGHVDIVDPALGHRRLALADVGRLFTGVALLLEPGATFAPGRALKPNNRYAQAILEQRPLLVRVLVMSVLLQLFSLSVPAATGAIVDHILPRDDVHLLLILSIGLAMVVAFQLLASLVRGHLLLQLRTHLDARLALGFLEHVINLPYQFFEQRWIGDMMARMNSNGTVREMLTSGALSGLLDGGMVFTYLILLYALSPGMAAMVTLAAALQVLVLLLTRHRQRLLMTEHLVKDATFQNHQVEMFSSIETLKAMGVEHASAERWSDLYVDLLNATLDRGRLDATTDALMGALRLGSPLVIVAYGCARVLDGQMSLGTMLALSALGGSFLVPMSNLIGTAIALARLPSYLERLEDVRNSPLEQASDCVVGAPKLLGRVTLDHVSFRFGPLAAPVIEDVCVDIEPGTSVAIVGRSGSGKSTLARILVGLFLPTSGRVLYDGADLAKLELRSVRRQIGVVPQTPHVFGRAVRHNIAFADPTTPMEAVELAAKRACLHDDIMAMPMAYETVLLNGGASLSGGQRQRLALARALLSEPSILLLDEATSALDGAAEAKVQAELAKLQCTRIVIAHRLSTIRTADVVLVLDGGRIVDRGKHHELLRRSDVYRSLFGGQGQRSAHAEGATERAWA